MPPAEELVKVRMKTNSLISFYQEKDELHKETTGTVIRVICACQALPDTSGIGKPRQIRTTASAPQEDAEANI